MLPFRGCKAICTPTGRHPDRWIDGETFFVWSPSDLEANEYREMLPMLVVFIVFATRYRTVCNPMDIAYVVYCSYTLDRELEKNSASASRPKPLPFTKPIASASFGGKYESELMDTVGKSMSVPVLSVLDAHDDSGTQQPALGTPDGTDCRQTLNFIL
jgi:hypothetical protein